AGAPPRPRARALRDDRLRLAVCRRDEVAHRQAVRVRGGEHATLAAHLDQHAGEQPTRLVTARAPRDLRDGPREAPRLRLDPRAAGFLEAREVLGRQEPQYTFVCG